MSAQSLKKRLDFKLLASLGLALVFIITVALVMSMAVKVTRGVSRTEETPKRVMRLEILNGCSRSGIAGEAAGILSDFKDSELEIIVIGTGDFDLRKVSRTFVVSRNKDKSAAEYLARLMGIESSEVTYKHLENNYRQVSATLVLGEDYVATMLPQASDKE
ncbi:MAG: LytR C-terminal domain-containing protein [Candidatus Zixiibacteriota bacterium]|nr:MAG: LytR C-terminal domain-containing protein [candidate division Zixibacteria bacterium]